MPIGSVREQPHLIVITTRAQERGDMDITRRTVVKATALGAVVEGKVYG